MDNPSVVARLCRQTLIAVTAIGAVVAFVSGVLHVATGADSGVGRWLVAICALLFAVGQLQFEACVQIVRRRPTALRLVLIAGASTAVWAIVEAIVVRHFTALQVPFAVIGLAELALVAVLINTAPVAPQVEYATDPVG